ncbi:transcription factor E2F3-like protein [Dinothrombium tinctorium]|uniref:Transcription factor E2F3-like protein n=1 Tax=Dinothrombium tinctorium TaxID=1965070 RepID=A0A3S3P8H5_9ACAR|nr:transcription factor E2F3-like protein [Dinothrombium tinctorium]RWS05705.1 transcription factor E2F3-like protein [Dinothrombium tinctorium]RWS07516.1 transcription factor E2F3-like protein [Dinothrombium tinctorium]
MENPSSILSQIPVVLGSGNSNNASSVTGVKSKHRYETSLGQLTKKFIGLLRKSPDGVINLNEASQVLEVQKRRIYDITNVLEGVGLLHKTSKNNIKWNGGAIDSSLIASGAENIHSRKHLEQENAHLEAKEKALDELIKTASLELQSATESKANKPYTYVTYRDLRCIKEFSEQTVIAIKAPSDTKLEVPDPRESLQIWLKSDKGEIEVYLCPEDDTCSASNSDEGKGTSMINDVESSMKTEDLKSDLEDNSLKHAFISEDDDLGPMGSKSYLMQTEDQTNNYIKMMHNYVNPMNDDIIPSSPLGSGSSLVDLPFLHLEPPLSDIYSFALDENEGIAELFGYNLKPNDENSITTDESLK